jgi:hypothetical protein
MSSRISASSFSTFRESSCLHPRSIEHVSPVELLADLYAHPGLVHPHLRPSLLAVWPRRIPPTEHPT